MTPYQDDLVVTGIGPAAADRVNRGIEAFMEEFYITLSRKANDSHPFSSTLFALGAEFRLGHDIPRVLPTVAKVEKFERLLDAISIHEAKSVPLNQIEVFADFCEYMSNPYRG